MSQLTNEYLQDLIEDSGISGVFNVPNAPFAHEILALRERIVKLEKIVVTDRVEFQDALDESTAVICEMEKEISGLKKENGELKVAKTEKNRELAKAKIESSKQSRKISDLNVTVRIVSSDLESKDEEIRSLKLVLAKNGLTTNGSPPSSPTFTFAPRSPVTFGGA